MKKLNEVNVEGEKVFLRKDFIGWHTVFPSKVDGKIVWKNFIAGGSWWKLIALIVFILIMIGAINEYTTAVSIANDYILSNQTIIPQIQNIPQLVYP